MIELPGFKAESMVLLVSLWAMRFGEAIWGSFALFSGGSWIAIQELGLSRPAPQYQEGQVTRPNSMGNVPEKCLDSRSLKSA